MKGQKCAKCNSPAKSILMLACIHNLCLRCVANNHSHIRQVNGEFFFRCIICKIHTLLDKETVEELQKNVSPVSGPVVQSHQSLFDSLKKDNFRESKIFSNQHFNSENDDRPVMRRSVQLRPLEEHNYSSPPLPKPTFEKRRLCKDHDEELNYYCFDCMKECICSECVIHGEHKGHNVKTLKHSYPVLKGKADSFVSRLKQNLGTSQSIRTELQVNIKNINREKLQMQKVIKDRAKDIRDALARVQGEMLQTVQEWASKQVRNNQQAIATLDQNHHINQSRIKVILDSLNQNSEFQFSHRFAALVPDTEKLFEFEYKDCKRIINPLEVQIETEGVIQKVEDLSLMIRSNKSTCRSGSKSGSRAQSGVFKKD